MKKVVVLLILSMLYMSPSFGYPPEYPYYQSDNIMYYVFESEKSVLQMEGFKQDNCSVAVCGSHFNKYQLNILMKECHPKEIIICFDKLV